MDPISLAISAVGLGLSIFGGMNQSRHAGQSAAVSQDIIKNEQSIQDAKQRQMELEGRRMQTENIRNIQRGRAMAQNAAVNQGAQFGSGLQGGLAQVQDQGFWNMLGVDQALQTGREISGYNKTISADKQQMASIQGQMATDQGISSIGGAVMKAGPIIGQISQGFGSGRPSSASGNNYGYTAKTYGNGYT